MAEVRELYSWDERNGAWVAVSSGTETDLQETLERQYRNARRFDMGGSAFVIRPLNDPPAGTPAELGVEVVETSG